MNADIEIQIINAEERLRAAMLASDVTVLNELLAPQLIFTNHLGQLQNKQDDLRAHESGALTLTELRPTEQLIVLEGDAAVVSVRMQLAGTYDSNPTGGDFRFTRIWALSPAKTWWVVAAHSCIVA